MVVKSKRGRRRYIAFETSPEISREVLIGIFAADFGREGLPVPKIIQFDGRRGIVRVNGTIVNTARTLMNNQNIKTLLTSGTLLTIRKRYPSVSEKRY